MLWYGMLWYGMLWYGVVYSFSVCTVLALIAIFHFQGSKDNMSVIVVTFPGAPKVSQQAIQSVSIFN